VAAQGWKVLRLKWVLLVEFRPSPLLLDTPYQCLAAGQSYYCTHDQVRNSSERVVFWSEHEKNRGPLSDNVVTWRFAHGKVRLGSASRNFAESSQSSLLYFHRGPSMDRLDRQRISLQLNMGGYIN
jgi:hypothetical protein